ncbi:hypothetical protein C8R48DRAFT_799831 [Suillus tomentosus]|nr:hypothetical protein C8R48DRAFT_799831 [Suillus tomentosus]
MAPHQAELPLADAMNVDVPVPLGTRNSFPPQTHSGRGRRVSRRRDWYRERSSLHQREARSQNADAMSAFTSFFRAEAEASKPPLNLSQRKFTNCRSRPRKEELATRKEAHAFSQQVRAECHSEPSRYHQRARHLTLDNRHVPRSSGRNNGHRDQRDDSRPAGGPSPRVPNPFVTRAPPPPTTQAPAMTAAQLIAAVVEEEARHPTIAQPPPLTPAIDPGPDVSEIVDAAERLDLERAARESEFSDTDFFGKLVVLALLVLHAILTYSLVDSLSAM